MEMKTAEQYNQELLTFIEKYPTSYHVIAGQKKMLEEAGYTQLAEHAAWNIRPGGKYFVIRNGSALAAFRVPATMSAEGRSVSAGESPRAAAASHQSEETSCAADLDVSAGFMIMASHSDSPALKIKNSPEMKVEDACTKLNVEPYGGLLMAPWFDRPLSVAGRIFVRTETGAACRLVNIDRDLLVIPSLAIHMNREANKGYAYNAQKDLLPLYGMADCRPLAELAAEAAGVCADDILDMDLFLYNRQPGFVFGAEQAFLGSPRLDDVQCAFASFTGFLESEPSGTSVASEGLLKMQFEDNDTFAEPKPEMLAGDASYPEMPVGDASYWKVESNHRTGCSIPVHVVFDNEEVGSSTRQGAASTFLADTLERISESLGDSRSDYRRRLAQSFMLSADNAHAVHPNHADKADPVSRPAMNKGIVLKYSANQKYTTDAGSAAVVRLLAEREDIPLQVFHNRSDLPGGSTLGNISGNQVSVCTADIGIAQLAMHSPCETCGAEDTVRMIALARRLFSSSLYMTEQNIKVFSKIRSK